MAGLHGPRSDVVELGFSVEERDPTFRVEVRGAITSSGMAVADGGQLKAVEADRSHMENR